MIKLYLCVNNYSLSIGVNIQAQNILMKAIAGNMLEPIDVTMPLNVPNNITA
jgi:hypothetical protein